MNLKFYLLLNIILVALMCLIMTAVYVLYQADKQSKQVMLVTAESLEKQLEMQLLRIDVGLSGQIVFPDLGLWKETRDMPGVCVRFITVDKRKVRGICRGDDLSLDAWPKGFERLYRLIFNPNFTVERQVSFKAKDYGVISVSSSEERELANAWASVRALMNVSMMTVLAVCLLVYISIARALRPAQIIVDGLDAMRKGDLSIRLPDFKVFEWQRTGTTINALATNQQQLLAERKELLMQLMTVQEEERRYLSRELHDELGQCLAGINALAMSVTQTVEQECPELVPDMQNISRINQRIMNTVRELLMHLRPVELDQSGFEVNLTQLIAAWNERTGEGIQYQLALTGEINQLPAPLIVALFRITQECLTNVARHSSATRVRVTLNRSKGSVKLTIEDNGDVDMLMFKINPGVGLLGIRERVSVLAGQLEMEKTGSGGFVVRVTLPAGITE